MNNIFLIAVLFLVGCSTLPSDESRISHLEESDFFNEQVYSRKIYPKIKKDKFIRGICYISESLESFVVSPCNKITMVLMDHKGVEVTRQETDSDGVFSFTVASQANYQITVDSKKYRTVSEKIFATPGAEVFVRLFRK